MKVYLVTCSTQIEDEVPIFGIYSTKKIAFEHANKIILKYGYDETKWNGDGRPLEKDGFYKGYAYISDFEIDKDVI